MNRPTPAPATSRTGRSAPIRARVSVPRLLMTLLLALACAGLAPRAAAQCVMCKESVYSQSDPSRNNALGAAFNDSVYFMLAVPALLIGGLALVIALNVRARARHEAAIATSSSDAASPPVAPPPDR